MDTKRSGLGVMLMVMSILGLLVMLVFLVLISGYAFAAGPGDAQPDEGRMPLACAEFHGKRGPDGPGGIHDGFGPVPKGMGFPRHFNLSKEQRNRLKKSRDRHFRETRELRYEMAMRELEMRRLFTDPKVDEAALLAKQKEIGALHQKLHDAMSQRMIEDRKILTPDQISKFDPMPFEPPGRDWGMMGTIPPGR